MTGASGSRNVLYSNIAHGKCDSAQGELPDSPEVDLRGEVVTELELLVHLQENRKYSASVEPAEPPKPPTWKQLRSAHKRAPFCDTLSREMRDVLLIFPQCTLKTLFFPLGEIKASHKSSP